MFIALLAAHTASACGGLVSSLDHSDQLAAADAMQAILDVGVDQVSIDYRVHYTGTAEDFAWIIPVPGEVAAVEEGSDDRFETLAALTAPQVNYWETTSPDDADPAGLFGCGGARSKNDLAGGLSDSGAAGQGLPVAVVGQGYAGDYSYTILTAEDSGAFAAWLTEAGYDLTYAAGPIADYVADPIGFQWVAVQLRPEVPSTPEGGVNISPLRIRYGVARGDQKLHPLFPARMGSTIQLAEVRTELYVVADAHAVGGNGWDTNTDGYLALSEGADPVAGYADFLRSVGGERRGLVETYKGAYTDDAGADRYLTRLDSIVTPATNVSDVAFSVDEDTTELRVFTIDVGNYYYGAAFPLVALGMAGAVWGRRRGRG